MNARFSQRLLAGFLAAASMAGITLTAAAEYPKPQSERYIGDASYFSNTTKPQSLTLKRGEASQFGLIDTIFVDENGNEYTIKVTDNDASKTPNTALPASYNSYDHGISTPVQNQNPYGSCWSFAGCAAAEGSMIYQGLAAGNTNYSEKHMVWFTLGKGPTDTSDPTYGDCENLGYDSYDRGGYDMDPIMTLAKWSGAELDSKVPFNVSSNNYSVDESYRYDSYAHIEDANFLDITNRNAIKQAIMESGELFFTYNHRFAAENDDTIFTYYNPSKTTYDGGHAVTLVGWDDNFSKDKFSTVNGLAKPSSNGAWLIKNSWGTGYGNNGFMWVSYEEATIKRIIQYRMAKTDNYDNNYQWDGNFYDSYWNSNGYANVFTAKSNEELKAVSTFFLESGYGCTLKIYTDITDKANPTSGKLAYSTTFDTAMGYHTYKLPSSIKLDKGENFAVWFDTQSFIVIDSNAYAENTTLTKSGSSWINCSFNASIKAFTDSEAVAKPQNVKAAVSGDKQVTVSWDSVAGATSYRVFRADSATGTKTLLKAVSTTSYTDTTVSTGKTYYYFVAAYNSATGKLSDYSAYAMVKVQTPLAAPTISAISTNGSSVTLNWSTVTGATSYRVYRADSAAGTKTLLKAVSTATYTDTTVTSGKTYYYFVAAYDSATSRLSAYSAAKSIKVQTPLAAPTISAISTNGSSVTLNWSTVTGATSYRIYRADSATGTKTLLKAVSTATYTDTTVTSGKTYYYFVAAYDSATSRLSAYSAAKSIKVQTPLAAPTISAISTNGSSVTLKWSTVTGATSYRIYRADSATGTKTLLKGVAATTYTDTTVTSGKTYYYF
ncbi:MAG: C1 family peptidase, partial [Oscillospiraceae bacterium]